MPYGSREVVGSKKFDNSSLRSYGVWGLTSLGRVVAYGSVLYQKSEKVKICFTTVVQIGAKVGQFSKMPKWSLYNRSVGRSKHSMGLKFEYNVEPGGTHFIVKNIFHMCKGAHTRVYQKEAILVHFAPFWELLGGWLNTLGLIFLMHQVDIPKLMGGCGFG